MKAGLSLRDIVKLCDGKVSLASVARFEDGKLKQPLLVEALTRVYESLGC